MAQLVKIGNSQGIRIPKPLIEQAHLEGKDLELLVVEGGLLITAKKGVREGWQESIENILETQKSEVVDHEWLDAPLASDDGEW